MCRYRYRYPFLYLKLTAIYVLVKKEGAEDELKVRLRNTAY